MELFYAYEVSGGVAVLDAEESNHCVKVLRHRAGDDIDVIDGLGTLYHCRLTLDSPKGAEAQVLEAVPGWNSHHYHLTIGCCPTKNNDRFEWFVEKATEIGVDCIVPLIGEHSERKVYKTDRAKRIALSATKQSLKARIPEIAEPVTVRDFLASSFAGPQSSFAGPQSSFAGPQSSFAGLTGESVRLIAYCFEGDQKRQSIKDVLNTTKAKNITILIGPEGDFSKEEAEAAIANGYIPVHLGPSRLRTETAAVTAAEAVYFTFL